MITRENLIEVLVQLRCFKYYIAAIDQWGAFEKMPEEGDTVKKSLARFDSETEVDEFLEDYRKKLTEHVQSLFVIEETTGDKLPVPLVKEIRKGKTPKIRKGRNAGTLNRPGNDGTEADSSRSD